jgi:sugar phosphate isomerase/epimerase
VTTEHRGSVYLAAGSFLDVSADELADIALATEGCDGIGLRLSGEHAIAATAAARHIRSRLADGGRRVFDAEVVRVSADFVAESATPLITRAVEVGAAHVLAVSDLDGSDPNLSLRAFEALARIARGHGLDLAVEYMAWTTPSDVDGALRVHSETGCRIVVDLLHHTRIGATVHDLERLMRADAVAWVQICDAPREREADSLLAEARRGRLIPGEGALPLRDLLAVVPSHVDISIEVQSDRLLGVDPRERARRLVDATRALLGRADRA